MTITATADLDEQFPQPQPSRSPARLRNNQLAATIAILLFALVAIGQLLQFRSDLDDQPQLTAQGARISQLQTELVRAGRIAAVTALDPSAGTGALDTTLDTVSRLVVQATAAGADADSLATVNGAVGAYGRLLHDAATTTDASRSSQLLANADQVLTDSLQPALETMASGVTQRAAAANWLGWAMAAGGLVVIGVLGWAWFRTSQLSHRMVNPGLAAAAILVAGMTILIVNTVTTTAGVAASTDSLRQASSLAGIQSGVEASAQLQARAVLTRAFTAEQAKAEQAARQATGKAIDNDTPTDIRKASSTAVDNLKDSADLLAKGSWDQARASLLGKNGSSLPTNLTALATDCDRTVQELIDDAAAAPSSQAAAVVGVAVGVAVLAAAAAVAAIWGVGTRLKEYQ